MRMNTFFFKILNTREDIFLIDEFLYIYRNDNKDSIMNSNNKLESLKNINLICKKLYSLELSTESICWFFKYLYWLPFNFIFLDKSINVFSFIRNTKYLKKVSKKIYSHYKKTSYYESINSKTKIVISFKYIIFFVPFLFLYKFYKNRKNNTYNH